MLAMVKRIARTRTHTGSTSKCSAIPPHTPAIILFLRERYSLFMPLPPSLPRKIERDAEADEADEEENELKRKELCQIDYGSP